MDFGAATSGLWQEVQWYFFYARYCAGRNIMHPLCEGFRWWAAAIAGLVAAIVVLLTLRRLVHVFRMWRHERATAKVADAKTMDKYRWSGFAAPDPKRPRNASK